MFGHQLAQIPQRESVPKPGAPEWNRIERGEFGRLGAAFEGVLPIRH